MTHIVKLHALLTIQIKNAESYNKLKKKNLYFLNQNSLKVQSIIKTFSIQNRLFIAKVIQNK